MHFLILGGSGRTGQLIIQEALSKGHQVTALVRKSASLQPQPNLSIIEGTPRNPNDMENAFSSKANNNPPPSAVVVALNARLASDSPFAAPSPDTPPRLLADSVAHAVAAMKRHGVRKIVVMSSMGAGSSFGSLNFAMRLVFSKTNMRLTLAEHNAVDAETRGAGVDFVLVRPVMLVEGPAAEVRVYADDGRGSGWMPRISRASVARFMVEALEREEFVGRAPVISN